MKLQNLTVILALISFLFGCGLTDKFKAASNTNANISAAPAPTASVTPTVSPTVKAGDAKNALNELGTNFLAFGAGTTVVSATSEGKAGGESARHLIDEAQFSGWETLEGDTENQSVVLELPARTTFKNFTVDIPFFNQYENAAPVKDFSIEVSDVSATEGFQKIVEGTAKKGERMEEQPQMFPAASQIPARWVRYTARNRWGEGKRIFTKELRGYGTQEPIPTIGNLSGTYEFYGASGGYSGIKMQLKQEGTAVIGCTIGEYSDTFEGGIEGRIVTLKSYRKYSPNIDSGVMIFTPDGQNLKYIYWLDFGKKSYDTLEPARKINDQISATCPNLSGMGGDKNQDAVKSKLEKNLADTGRAVLYGINFDFNSDVIKPESRPTLDKVVAILKEKADWNLAVEGHTDNVGGATFNQTLSEKRAASVLKYLTGAGIDASRLSSTGFGLSKPVSSNDSETGRAQNRRVELVKQ